MTTFLMSQLGALGQTDCGEAPGVGPGEAKVCCPELGWVVYDNYESQYGLCERAQAQATGQPAPSRSFDVEVPEGASPMERVALMRAALEDRRNAQDEATHQERLQDVKLRFVIGQINAVKRSEEARLSSIAAAQARERAARAKVLADAARSKRNTKLFAIGAGALVVGKLLKFF